MEKFKFAQLIFFIGSLQHRDGLTVGEIHEIDRLISEGTPKPETVQLPPNFGETELLELLASIKQGKKIEAIRAYRQMTGKGLKESKDIIEMYSPTMDSAAIERLRDNKNSLLEFARETKAWVDGATIEERKAYAEKCIDNLS